MNLILSCGHDWTHHVPMGPLLAYPFIRMCGPPGQNVCHSIPCQTFSKDLASVPSSPHLSKSVPLEAAFIDFFFYGCFKLLQCAHNRKKEMVPGLWGAHIKTVFRVNLYENKTLTWVVVLCRFSTVEWQFISCTEMSRRMFNFCGFSLKYQRVCC